MYGSETTHERINRTNMDAGATWWKSEKPKQVEFVVKYSEIVRMCTKDNIARILQ